MLEDLDRRGLLDETLVVCMAEFGRTPRLDSNGGRGHWGSVFSVTLAGGGIRGGQVYGSSDRIGAYPTEGRVRPEDLSATIWHCLGYAPQTRARCGRFPLETARWPQLELNTNEEGGEPRKAPGKSAWDGMVLVLSDREWTGLTRLGLQGPPVENGKGVMGEQTADGNGDLPPTAAARIDDACAFYMSAWQSGHRPRIEEALEICARSILGGVASEPAGARPVAPPPGR